MKFAVIVVTLCALFSLNDAKEEAKGNIEKFYKSNIERQAEETDSQRIQSFVKPDEDPEMEDEEPVTTSTVSPYLSRGFGNRRINPKGRVVDDPIAKSESRRLDEVRYRDELHEPHVHESEPEEPAIVVTEIITRHSEYTTETPVTSRSQVASQQSSMWPGYSTNFQSYPQQANHRSSGQSVQKSTRHHKESSSSSSSYAPENNYKSRESGDNKEEQEAQPSMPEPTNPESSIKVKEGQAAARQYFYNSRWVPKSYAHQAQQTNKRQEYGNSGYGQETQQLNKVAERDNEMLLVFAHSIEIPLVVASPSAMRRSNSVFQSTSEPSVPTAPRIVFITDPRASQQTLQTPKPVQQQRRSFETTTKSSPLLTQRWGSPGMSFPAAAPQMRMMPLRYPVMRRNSFAYPYADVTTSSASEASMVTTKPLSLRSYHPQHHYPNYINGRRPSHFLNRDESSSSNNRGLVIPMPSEKLVTILPL